MGCDIHMVLEQKHDGKWIGIDTFTGHYVARRVLKEDQHDWQSPVARDRDYNRFAKLAGVRGEGPAPRGLPVDASDTTMLLSEEWGGDGHSHSWLPLAEAVNIFSQTEGLPEDHFGAKHPTSYFFGLDCSEGSQRLIGDYRLVFWFDN